MMGVEPVAALTANDAPSRDTTWVAQCGRWEPLSAGGTVINYLTLRHNKKSDSVFADGHVEAVGQIYATNRMY